jgi:hypothetical protein
MKKSIKSIVDFARRNVVTMGWVLAIAALGSFALNAIYWETVANRWADYWCLHYHELENKIEDCEDQLQKSCYREEMQLGRIKQLKEAMEMGEAQNRFYKSEVERLENVQREYNNQKDLLEKNLRELGWNASRIWNDPEFVICIADHKNRDVWLECLCAVGFSFIDLSAHSEEEKQSRYQLLSGEYSEKRKTWFDGESTIKPLAKVLASEENSNR